MWGYGVIPPHETIPPRKEIADFLAPGVLKTNLLSELFGFLIQASEAVAYSLMQIYECIMPFHVGYAADAVSTKDISCIV